MSKYDEEKTVGETTYSESPPHEDMGEIIIASRPKVLTMLNHFLSRLGGEERGIERVLPHEKSDQVYTVSISKHHTNLQHPYDNFSVWMSANLTVSTFSLGTNPTSIALITIGTLGPGLFYLGWWDSFLTILFFNAIGMIPPAYMATFGPKMGLRAMTIPRSLSLDAKANFLGLASGGMVLLFSRAPMLLLVWDGTTIYMHI